MSQARIIIAGQEGPALEIATLLLGLGYPAPAVLRPGPEILEEVEKGGARAVLIDLDPSGTGLDTARALRARWPGPVILVGAPRDLRNSLGGDGAKPFPFLIRPIREEDLELVLTLAGRASTSGSRSPAGPGTDSAPPGPEPGRDPDPAPGRARPQVRGVAAPAGRDGPPRAGPTPLRASGSRKDNVIRFPGARNQEGESRVRGAGPEGGRPAGAGRSLGLSLDLAEKVLDESQVLVLILDLQGLVRGLNRKLAELLGQSRSELMGRDWFGRVVPAGRPSPLGEAFRKALAGGPVESTVDRLPAGPGRELRIHWRSTLLRDPGGQVTGFISVGQDITPWIRDQEALAESEERFRQTADLLPVIVAEIDPDGRIDYLNETGLRTLNYRAADLERGLTAREIIHPDDLGLFKEAAARIMNGGRAGPAQYRLKRRQGGFLTAMVNSGPIARQGKTMGLRTAILDVTEYKRAERQARRNAAQFRSIFEGSVIGIILTDREGQVLAANPAFQKMLGYSETELISRSVEEMSHPEDWRPESRLLKELVTGRREHFQLEKRFLRKDGSAIWARLTVFLVDQGQAKFPLSMIEDITARKEAEAQAKLHQDQLLQADKMVALGTLVSGVAHEINNPITFVMLNAPILDSIWQELIPILEEYRRLKGEVRIGRFSLDQLKEKVPLLLSDISQGARRVKAIVTDLKNYARSSPADLKEQVDLNQALKSAATLVANLIKKATGRFDLNCQPGLPLFPGNGQQVEQVIINLLVNACQATLRPELPLSAVTYHDRARNAVVVEIEDQGIGIEPGILKRITDPFFTTKRDSGGTGLGLAVSARIVENHGGMIAFHSRPGKGTRVAVRFPVDPDQDRGAPGAGRRKGK